MDHINSKLDIIVAKFTKGLAKSQAPNASWFYKLFPPKVDFNTPDKEIIVDSFDWQGNLLYTSCDDGLGYNTWDIRNGKFLYRINGISEEYYSTIFTFSFDNGVIFGNGKYCYYGENYGQVLDLDKELNTKVNFRTFTLENITNSALFISGDFLYVISSKIPLSNSFANDKFQFSFTKLPKEHESISNYTKITPLPFSNKKSILAAIYCSSTTNLDENRFLSIINPITNKIVLHTQHKGLQNISKHPSKNTIAIIGLNLSILSYDSGEVIKSIELTLPRSNDEAVIAYSSCGRYIALSYAITGEIEIRNSDNLSLEFILHGKGIPKKDICWDISSCYLACVFSKDSSIKLVVWNIRTKDIVLETDSSYTSHTTKPFQWSPYSTKLACLRNRQIVSIYNFD